MERFYLKTAYYPIICKIGDGSTHLCQKSIRDLDAIIMEGRWAIAGAYKEQQGLRACCFATEKMNLCFVLDIIFQIALIFSIIFIL